MASKPVIKYTCDRCGRSYDEEPNQAAPKKATPPAIMLEAHLKTGTASPAKVLFDDLCTKCDSRVWDLIGQIALDETKPRTEDSKTPDPAAPPALDAKTKPSDNKDKPDAGKAAEKTATTH